jgi:hypothetical protein
MVFRLAWPKQAERTPMKPTTDDLPRHAALKQFPVQDDCLQLGGPTASPTGLPGHPAPLEMLV